MEAIKMEANVRREKQKSKLDQCKPFDAFVFLFCSQASIAKYYNCEYEHKTKG
jgi:hypothetical protein